MTKTYTTADVCEQAHARLLNDPEILAGRRHSYYNPHDEELRYTNLGQKIFNYYYDEVENELIKKGYKKEK